MMNLQERLLAKVVEFNLPYEKILKLYVLERLLWRVMQCAESEKVIVRGSLLTRNWALPAILRGEDFRPVQDLDLMGDYAFDLERGLNFIYKFVSILSNDSLEIIDAKPEYIVIWEETVSPGLRVDLRVRIHETDLTIQMDMSFNDPLVPPAVWSDYIGLLPENCFKIFAPTPELACAWKIHGLFEFYGQYGKTWRLKDLYDVYLILKHKSLNINILEAAIRVAFESRNTAFDCYKDILENRFGQSSKRLRAWRRLNEKWSERVFHTSHLPLLEYMRTFTDPIFIRLMGLNESSNSEG
jgi:hypothetical protein